MEKTYTIFEVLYRNDNTQYGGAFGDGTYIARFKKRANADKFAAENQCYGDGPATVQTVSDVPRRLIDRWVFSG